MNSSKNTEGVGCVVTKIALTGKMRSGKSSVAEHLTTCYGFKQFAFADALKRFARQIFGYGGPKDRELLQWFGQTMRERDPDVWIKHLDADLEEYIEDSRGDIGVRIVITDLRQPNEYDYCRRNGFVIIRVNCPEETRIVRAVNNGDIFHRSALNHETERYVDLFEVDYEIDNSDGWYLTARQIDSIMKDLGVNPK